MRYVTLGNTFRGSDVSADAQYRAANVQETQKTRNYVTYTPFAGEEDMTREIKEFTPSTPGDYNVNMPISSKPETFGATMESGLIDKTHNNTDETVLIKDFLAYKDTLKTYDKDYIDEGLFALRQLTEGETMVANYSKRQKYQELVTHNLRSQLRDGVKRQDLYITPPESYATKRFHFLSLAGMERQEFFSKSKNDDVLFNTCYKRPQFLPCSTHVLCFSMREHLQSLRLQSRTKETWSEEVDECTIGVEHLWKAPVRSSVVSKGRSERHIRVFGQD